MVPEVEELSEGEPAEVVLENARRKARAGAALAGAGPRDLVLGVDTDVSIDGALLGKAGTEAEARRRLERLSGRVHEVLSGVVLIDGTGERSGVARSEVGFRQLGPGAIDLYLASGEWRDRAGAYAVQGLGSTLVKSLQGDLSNVIGLPVALLLQLAPELRKL